MEIYFIQEQEAQWAQIARRDGKADAGGLLDEEDRFRAAVLEGKAYADRDEFIEEEETDDRIERMLRY